MKTETMWLDVPILVKCLRRRCQKAEHYLMLRPTPIPLRSFAGEEAPATLLTVREKNCSMEMVPGRLTASVRRLPDGWATPLVLPDGTPADPVDPTAPLRGRNDGMAWQDSPFSLDQNVVRRLRPDVYAEKDLHVVHMETDVDLRTREEAASLARDLVLVDGAMHRVRRAPSLSVLVRSNGHDLGSPRRPSQVTVNASLMDPQDERSLLSHQRFAPDRFDVAVAYANRVSLTLRCPARVMSRFECDGYEGGGHGDDFHAYVTSLRRRFPEAAQGLVGALGRRRVESYLDLRDGAAGGMDDEAFVDGFVALYLSVRAGEGSLQATLLLQAMQYDLMRIEAERPGFVVFAEADVNAALATLDEESFLTGM